MKSILLPASFILSLTTILAQSPGGESSNLNLWLAANNNGGITVDGNTITTWEDQSGEGNDASNDGTPSYEDDASNLFNYNPTVYFNGSNDAFELPDGTLSIDDDNYSYFVVFSSPLTDNNSTLFHSGVNSSNQWVWTCVQSDGALDDRFNSVGVNNGPSGSVQANTPTIVHFTYNTSTNTKSTYVNGTLASQKTGLANKISNNSNHCLGKRNINLYYRGNIAEAIVYNDSKTNSNEQEKINTYLAIKYGITLGHNYISSSNATVFDVSDYNNDIIALSRDDNCDQLQKQSSALDNNSQIYLSSLTNLNQVNTGSFNSDGQFLIAGHDDGELCSTLAVYSEKPNTIYSRIEREWKVTNTNFDNSFSLTFNLDACAGSITTADLRLLIDDDGDFSNAQIYASGGGLTINHSSNTVTISGVSNSHIPINSTKYITLGSANSNTPLPIELAYFEGQLVHQNTVQLNWQTLAEINNDYFIVEKSTDGNQWDELSQLDGAGNSTGMINYSTIDYLPYRPCTFYRIKQVDYNGEYSYSSMIKIISQPKLKVHPNPTKDWIYIADQFDRVRVLNTYGILIKEEYNSPINLSHLPPGSYIIEIISSNSRSREIIIKE